MYIGVPASLSHEPYTHAHTHTHRMRRVRTGSRRHCCGRRCTCSTRSPRGSAMRSISSYGKTTNAPSGCGGVLAVRPFKTPSSRKFVTPTLLPLPVGLVGVVGIEDGAWCARGVHVTGASGDLVSAAAAMWGVVQGGAEAIRLGGTDEEMTVLRERERESVCVCVMPLRACSWLGAERERERERRY